MIYLDQNSATKFFLCIRLFNILRIIIIFPTLQKTFNSYIRAALSVYKVYLSFFGLMLFYSVFGLYLFYGLEENRCRASETPPPGQTIWEPLLVEFPSYCGDWQCDIGFLFIEIFFP